MRGKWLLIGALVVGLGVIAGVLTHERNRRQLEVQQAKAKSVAAIPSVGLVTISGHIRAPHTVNVPAPISGKIQEMLVEVGQEVVEGQLLAQIQSQSLTVSQQEADLAVERAQEKVNRLESAIIAARLEASRARAEASRANAEFSRTQRNHQRQRMLLSEGATPKVVAEKAEKEFQAAEREWNNLDAVAKVVEDRVEQLQKEHESAKKILAQMQEDRETVKAQLNAGQVHAPAAGYVVARRADSGTDVDESMEDMFQIATDITSLEFVADVDQATLARIAPGRPATIHVAELPSDSLPGVVQKVEGSRVVIEFTSPNPAIKPGLSAQARIQ